MRIGELAIRAGTSVETIRYYEKTGLLEAPRRQPNGYRSYGETHLQRLSFIRHCRALDMSLADIKRLLDFVVSPEKDCDEINRLVDEQLIRVRECLSAMRTLEKQLAALREKCGGNTSASRCGILHTLLEDGRKS